MRYVIKTVCCGVWPCACREGGLKGQVYLEMLSHGQAKFHALLGQSEAVQVRVMAELDLFRERDLLPGLV